MCLLIPLKLKKKVKIETVIDVIPYRSWKQLEKYITIWTKIEDSKNIELNAVPVFDEEHMAIKFILTYHISKQILPASINRQMCL